MNKRITMNPLICHGKPVIRGTRVLVKSILSDLATGQPYSEIITNYPSISEEDIKAALQFGSELANFDTFSYESVQK